MSTQQLMRGKPVVKSVLTAILVAQVLISCVLEKNDIYEDIPRGTPLSKDILSKAGQIVLQKKDVLILINTSDTWEYYDPHVVFFDSTLTCRAACYFPSSRIDSISEKIIYARLHDERNKRKSSFRNDLYDGYIFQWTDPNISKVGRRSDKIIQGYQVTDNFEIILYVLRSSNRYENESKTLDLTKFIKPDTLVFALNSLLINPEKREFSIRTNDEHNVPEAEGILFRDVALQNKFYDELFERISNR